MSGLRVEQRKYADHWPVWCVVDDDRVILCRQSEQQARKELEQATAASMPKNKRR